MFVAFNENSKYVSNFQFVSTLICLLTINVVKNKYLFYFFGWYLEDSLLRILVMICTVPWKMIAGEAFNVIVLSSQSNNFLLFSHYHQIYKEPAFGRLNYNVCLLDGYTPSMFSNGVPHENQKTFLMQICKIAQQSKIFETSVKLIKEYCTIWLNAGNIKFLF